MLDLIFKERSDYKNGSALVVQAPRFFDIHSHLNFKDYDSDREDIIRRMKENGVWTATVGTSLATSKEAVDFADKNENLFATVGIHPTDSNDTFDEVDFKDLVQHPKTVAVGECGLDFFRVETGIDIERTRQRELFEAQIHFAAKHNKPLMIHARETYEEIYEILRVCTLEYGDTLRGNIHFFAGDVGLAKKFLDLGFTISFTGVITFARNYDEVVRYVPENVIMAETDAPFVAPVPYRGKRNEPVYVKEVVKKMAELRGVEEERMAKVVVENAIKMFNIVT